MDFQCEVVGQGPLHDELNQLLRELELRQVKPVGPKTQEELCVLYRRAALFAAPCLVGRDGNRDGLPTVLLEAMASGLPVVSTDVTGIPEIVEHDVNGLLVPQGDARALADALARLLRDAELRVRAGRAARQKVEREFDVRKNVAVLSKWLSEGVGWRACAALVEGVALADSIQTETFQTLPSRVPSH